MDEIIDMLRNKTIMGRFSRGEIRDFLERLEVEGLVIAPIAKEPEQIPSAFMEDMPPSEVNEAARAYMAAQPSLMSESEPEPAVEPDLVGPVLSND